MAGEVVELGPDVTTLAKGDAVFGCADIEDQGAQTAQRSPICRPSQLGESPQAHRRAYCAAVPSLPLCLHCGESYRVLVVDARGCLQKGGGFGQYALLPLRATVRAPAVEPAQAACLGWPGTALIAVATTPCCPCQVAPTARAVPAQQSRPTPRMCWSLGPLGVWGTTHCRSVIHFCFAL